MKISSVVPDVPLVLPLVNVSWVVLVIVPLVNILDSTPDISLAVYVNIRSALFISGITSSPDSVTVLEVALSNIEVVPDLTVASSSNSTTW